MKSSCTYRRKRPRWGKPLLHDVENDNLNSPGCCSLRSSVQGVCLGPRSSDPVKLRTCYLLPVSGAGTFIQRNERTGWGCLLSRRRSQRHLSSCEQMRPFAVATQTKRAAPCFVNLPACLVTFCFVNRLLGRRIIWEGHFIPPLPTQPPHNPSLCRNLDSEVAPGASVVYIERIASPSCHPCRSGELRSVKRMQHCSHSHHSLSLLSLCLMLQEELEVMRVSNTPVTFGRLSYLETGLDIVTGGPVVTTSRGWTNRVVRWEGCKAGMYVCMCLYVCACQLVCLYVCMWEHTHVHEAPNGVLEHNFQHKFSSMHNG